MAVGSGRIARGAAREQFPATKADLGGLRLVCGGWLLWWWWPATKVGLLRGLFSYFSNKN